MTNMILPPFLNFGLPILVGTEEILLSLSLQKGAKILPMAGAQFSTKSRVHEILHAVGARFSTKSCPPTLSYRAKRAQA